MAAHEQGRFRERRDRLFLEGARLDRAALEEHARALGLDPPRLRRALDTGAWDACVEADVVEAQRRGGVGTPAFFVNGQGGWALGPWGPSPGSSTRKLRR